MNRYIIDDRAFRRVAPSALTRAAPESAVTIFDKSTITCPLCGASSLDVMPTRAALCFFDCAQCGAMSRPVPGDCCVFCSYGDMGCPSAQVARYDQRPQS